MSEQGQGVEESIGVQGGDELTGSPAGSLQQAGSPQGGASAGREDPEQDAIDESLKVQDASPVEGKSFSEPGGADTQLAVNNTGPGGDPVEGKRDDDDVDAASG
jgi:hypothetical protein